MKVLTWKVFIEPLLRATVAAVTPVRRDRRIFSSWQEFCRAPEVWFLLYRAVDACCIFHPIPDEWQLAFRPYSGPQEVLVLIGQAWISMFPVGVCECLGLWD